MKTAVELRAAFAARELSPVEIIDAAAEHAELGAFVTLTLERAREEAKRAERAYADGTARPLEGLTLAVKDLYDTEGVETTYGSKIFKGHVPKADAYAVQRARDAGAIVVGKTLTHEFAWGITSNNPHFAPCRNPWDPERIPGGSSGGSAVALATGGAALALGDRHRRLDPDPRRVLRRLRPQADLQPDPGDGRLPARPLARPCRADGAHARRTSACSSRR